MLVEIHERRERTFNDNGEAFNYIRSEIRELLEPTHLTAVLTSLQFRYKTPNSKNMPCGDCLDTDSYGAITVEEDILVEIDPFGKKLNLNE